MGLFDSIISDVGNVVSGIAGDAEKVGSSLLTGGASGTGIVGPLITGGASLLGGILSNKNSANSVADQEAFQSGEADTTYQRGVADMEAAGINPIMAYQQGGDPAPSGASYTASDVITPAVNSAMSANKNLADTSLVKTQIANTASQTDLNSALALKAKQDAATSAAQESSYNANTMSTLAGLGTTKLEGDAAGYIDDLFGSQGASHLNDMIQQLTGGSSSAKSTILPPPTVK